MKLPKLIKGYLKELNIENLISEPLFCDGKKNPSSPNLNRRVGGVYVLIGNYRSNFVEVPVYVGGSLRGPERVKTHFMELKGNRHKNSVLQRAFNKEGGKFWAFILEFCPREEVMDAEQRYLDSIRPFLSEGRGYNMEKKAKRVDFPRSKVVAENVKKKIGEKNSRPFEVVNPEGEIVKGKNLTEFCRQNGLDAPLLCAVINKRRRSHKGYTRVGDDKTRKERQVGPLNQRRFSIEDPNGQIHEGVNFKKFCDLHGLNYNGALKQLFGKRSKDLYKNKFKGWKLANNE